MLKQPDKQEPDFMNGPPEGGHYVHLETALRGMNGFC